MLNTEGYAEMTYEKFANNVEQCDDTVTRKDISKFIIRYSIIHLLISIAVVYGCSIILGTGFAFLLMLLCIALFIVIFDVFSSSAESFKRANKFSKLWILFAILALAGIIAMKMFL